MKKFKVGDKVYHVSNKIIRMPVIEVGENIKCTMLTDSGIRKELDFHPGEIFLADDDKITINFN